MTIAAPVPIAAGPTVPDSSSIETTFDTQFEAFNAWMKNSLQPGVNAIAENVYANASDAQNSAISAQDNAALSALSASISSASAGATLWVSGSSYAIGQAAISPINVQLYRRKVAGAGTIDPSIDTSNWASVASGLSRSYVTTTTQSATAGNDYWLTNVSATTVTAPTATDGAKFRVTPVNGLITNVIDFGATTVLGPFGTMTGTLTLDLGLRMEFEYSSTLTKWVSK